MIPGEPRRGGRIVRMKKVKSGNLSSAAKGNIAPKNVDEYLAGVPEPACGRIFQRQWAYA